MAGKSDAAEQAVLDALLRNDTTALSALIGATRYLRLHTADPTDSGVATASEATYGSYAALAITSTSGWTSSGNPRSNTGVLTWPQCTGGSSTITHVSLTTAATGATALLYVFALTSSLAVTNNVTPQIAIGSLTSSED